MKRFSPRDLTLYLLVIVLMLFAVTSLQQMNQADGPTYSDIRALFVQEKVSYFELEDNTLTLTLRESDGGTSTVTYQVARPDWLYQDLHQLWEDQMEAGLLRYDLPPGVEIAPASQVIEMEDNPARAFKDKPDASMTVGLRLLKEGRGEAFVSAGSTGALLSAATLLIKRIRGIRRAALAPVVPNAGGNMVLIDCGATAEGTPEYLLQFAFMGAYYARRFLGIENPRVGLLNIGTEPSKGMELQKAAHALLTQAHEAGRIRFVGNIEGREAISQGRRAGYRRVHRQHLPENRGGGGLPLQPRPKGHAPGQHQEQAGRLAAEKQHRGLQETL